VKAFRKFLPPCSAILLVLVLIFLGSRHAYALDVTLEWDPVQDAASYLLYYGVNSRYNPCIGNPYPSSLDVPLAEDENPDPDTFQYTVSGLLDNETYFFAVKAVDENGLESHYSNEEATLCITCAKLDSCETDPTASFYVNDEPGSPNDGSQYTVRGRADANTQVTLSDEYDNAWSTQADSDRNWAVTDLNFESLYGKSNRYVTFSVESEGSTWNATAIYDVTDPESRATSATDAGRIITITWSADDTTSGVGFTELYCKGPISGKWASTELSQGGTSGTFYYIPHEGDGAYYFATRSVDKAGNWQSEPNGDGDISTQFIAPVTDPTGKEGGGGGCFIDALLPPSY
jgi:hypothetical protein